MHYRLVVVVAAAVRMCMRVHAYASYLLINGELHQIFQTPQLAPSSIHPLPPLFSLLGFLSPPSYRICYVVIEIVITRSYARVNCSRRSRKRKGASSKVIERLHLSFSSFFIRWIHLNTRTTASFMLMLYIYIHTYIPCIYICVCIHETMRCSCVSVCCVCLV
jgi:hypothetical protein